MFHKASAIITGLITISLFASILIINTKQNTISGNALLDNSDWTKNGGIYMTPGFSPHWDHMPISYKINENCGVKETSRIKKAIEIIKTETEQAVTFIEQENSPDIEINCQTNFPKNAGGYEAGLARISYEYDKILNATITFFGISPSNSKLAGGCISYPYTELHELLHVLGFGHSTKTSSIMNPYAGGCIVKFDKDIAQKLKEIYRR